MKYYSLNCRTSRGSERGNLWIMLGIGLVLLFVCIIVTVGGVSLFFIFSKRHSTISELTKFFREDMSSYGLLMVRIDKSSDKFKVGLRGVLKSMMNNRLTDEQKEQFLDLFFKVVREIGTVMIQGEDYQQKVLVYFRLKTGLLSFSVDPILKELLKASPDVKSITELEYDKYHYRYLKVESIDGHVMYYWRRGDIVYFCEWETDLKDMMALYHDAPTEPPKLEGFTYDKLDLNLPVNFLLVSELQLSEEEYKSLEDLGLRLPRKLVLWANGYEKQSSFKLVIEHNVLVSSELNPFERIEVSEQDLSVFNDDLLNLYLKFNPENLIKLSEQFDLNPRELIEQISTATGTELSLEDLKGILDSNLYLDVGIVPKAQLFCIYLRADGELSPLMDIVPTITHYGILKKLYKPPEELEEILPEPDRYILLLGRNLGPIAISLGRNSFHIFGPVYRGVRTQLKVRNNNVRAVYDKLKREGDLGLLLVLYPRSIKRIIDIIIENPEEFDLNQTDVMQIRRYRDNIETGLDAIDSFALGITTGLKLVLYWQYK